MVALSPVLGDATAVVAASSVDVAALRPLWLAIGTTIAALIVGLVSIAGASSFVRTVGDDIAERPDLAFAAGFVVVFGLLVAVALPLIVSTAVGIGAVAALAALISFPGLILWGLVLLVGSCLGAVAVGTRVADRRGDDASLLPAVVVGALGLGASQLVPVLGALVAMGLATVATGAVVRRRFDVDSRLFDADGEPTRPTARATPPRSSGAERATPDRTRVDASSDTGTGDERTAHTPVRGGRASERDAAPASEPDDTGIDAPSDSRRDRGGWDTDGRNRADDSASGDGETTDRWTVDDWAWEIESDDDEDGDETEDRDETRERSDDER